MRKSSPPTLATESPPFNTLFLVSFGHSELARHIVLPERALQVIES